MYREIKNSHTCYKVIENHTKTCHKKGDIRNTYKYMEQTNTQRSWPHQAKKKKKERNVMQLTIHAY